MVLYKKCFYWYIKIQKGIKHIYFYFLQLCQNKLNDNIKSDKIIEAKITQRNCLKIEYIFLFIRINFLNSQYFFTANRQIKRQ